MTELPKRICPRPGPNSVVGDKRDVDVLSDLDQAGFLTTSQIQSLRFPSRRTAQRRLRVLLDHGLVRAYLQGEALHLENVYTLTSTGLDRLVEMGHEPYSQRPKRLPSVSKLQHALRVRDVFIAARRLAREGACHLVDFRFDDDLAAEPELRAAKLIPDAIAFLAVAGNLDHRISLAVEVDLGTEKIGTLRTKLMTYRNLLADAIVNQLLVLVTRESRKNTIANMAVAHGLTHCVVGLLGETEHVKMRLQTALEQ
jgi:hypothetical protein